MTRAKNPDPSRPVLGVVAPRARPTLAGGFWLAGLAALAGGVVLITIELALRWAF